MNAVRVISSVAWILTSLPSSASVPVDPQPEEEHYNCRQFGGAGSSPRFTIESQNHSAGAPHPLNLYLTVPGEAIGTQALVNLACRINRDFPGESLVDAYIFDDKKAAKHLVLGWEDQPHYILYLWHLKARYHLDRERKQEFVEFVFPELRDGLLNLRRVKMWIQDGG